MIRIGIGVVIGALMGAATSGAARSPPAAASDTPAGPAIHVEDVDRFFAIYDAAGGHPTADQLQHDYLDPGSDGLHQLARIRNVSGARIADTLAKRPEIYSNAKRCMLALPRVRERLDVALRTLGRLYPEARFPPVTIAVGRGKPVGVGVRDRSRICARPASASARRQRASHGARRIIHRTRLRDFGSDRSGYAGLAGSHSSIGLPSGSCSLANRP